MNASSDFHDGFQSNHADLRNCSQFELAAPTPQPPSGTPVGVDNGVSHHQVLREYFISWSSVCNPMGLIRPELAKGVFALSMFLLVIISVQFLYPYQISESGYTAVDLHELKMNPPPVEELNISSSATVVSLIVMRGASLILTTENVTLQIRTEVLLELEHLPASGERILFRGTFYILPVYHVVVHEFYMLNRYSSITRSIPGIVLFVVLFFYVFTPDFKRLAFLPRRVEDA